MNKRYLKVLRMSLLIRNVPLDRGLADRPYAGDVVTPGPHTGESGFEPRELLPQCVRSKTLELSRNLGWSKGWVTLNKNVNVVGHDFHSMYRGFKFLSLLVEKGFEALFNFTRKKFLTVLRAPHKVILQREDRASIGLVPWVRHLINSTCIIPRRVCFWQIFNLKEASASSVA